MEIKTSKSRSIASLKSKGLLQCITTPLLVARKYFGQEFYSKPPLFPYLLVIILSTCVFVTIAYAKCQYETLTHYEMLNYTTLFRDDSFNCKSTIDPLCEGVYVEGKLNLRTYTMEADGTFTQYQNSKFTMIDCSDCPGSPWKISFSYYDPQPTINGYYCVTGQKIF